MALLSFKKKLTAPLLAMVSVIAIGNVSAANLDEGKLSRVNKDLKVMKNILKTSLSEQFNSRASVEGLYLAGQGMLFTIEQRDGFHFEFREFSMPEIPAVPIAPVAPVKPPKGGFSVEFTEEQIEQIEEAAMVAAESAMEMAEISLDYMSDMDWSSKSSAERSAEKAEQNALRTEKRELELQARRLERQVRNMERKLRDSEFEEHLEGSEKEGQKTIELKKEMSELTESLSGVAAKLKENSGKLQKKAKEIKEKQEKKMKERLVQTEKVLSEVVCDFGSGLRSLQKGEHITFRIEGRPDRMYVFDKRDIMGCADGKLDYAKLLDKAIKYAI